MTFPFIFRNGSYQGINCECYSLDFFARQDTDTTVEETEGGEQVEHAEDAQKEDNAAFGPFSIPDYGGYTAFGVRTPYPPLHKALPTSD